MSRQHGGIDGQFDSPRLQSAYPISVWVSIGFRMTIFALGEEAKSLFILYLIKHPVCWLSSDHSRRSSRIETVMVSYGLSVSPEPEAASSASFAILTISEQNRSGSSKCTLCAESSNQMNSLAGAHRSS